ncbi:P35 family lipoprotein [Malacoplasma penetrans]|uniref:P35 family lipoprotein n=1 Tax=Malacoplasma penetrans TaxID=28227 RepID=UPI001E3186FF|nr:P35 family lipoprotein [Malacoplasma penetrans]
MKIKKIKLLKALALTGAFGIVATVPVIVSSCSSTSDNNGGSNNNGNGDNQQQTELTPALKSNVNLQGKLTGIYDTNTTDRKNTSTLIVADMKANPDNYFTNGNEIKEGIQSSEITVDGGFSTTSSWDGDAYDTWKTGATQVMYPTAAPQINIASLNDLKETTFKDETAINKFFTDASLSESVKDVTGLNVANKLHLENGDLLHVNVKGTKTDKSEVKIDLQIPVSNLNLKTTLKVSIKGGTNIKEVTDLETSFSYNIGIDATLNFTQTKGTAPEVTSSDVSDELLQLKLS